jgi:hypothetical protein
MRKLAALALVLPLLACDKDKSTDTAASASAVVSAAPSAVASTPPSAAPSASAAPEPPHDCPEGSSGIGSFAKPCETKGTARMLEVSASAKTDKDGNPQFNVKNKSAKLAVLYGKLAIYFYDKSGKQIDVKEPIEGSEKTHAYHICSGGNIFAGAVNPNEKFLLSFSCMKKKDVPEGTTTMEAEAQIVGFADSTGKKTDFYWRNNDLTPEARPKGGIK